MKRIFKEIPSSNGKRTYDVMLTLDDDRKLILNKSSCTCIFGSWYGFAGKFKKTKTLCRHILQALAIEGIELPKESRTKRNLKIYNMFNKNEKNKKTRR